MRLAQGLFEMMILTYLSSICYGYEKATNQAPYINMGMYAIGLACIVFKNWK